jgi:hypothetical protein
MVTKGIISYNDNYINNTEKIKCYNNIKTNKNIDVVFNSSSPDIIKQASLFLNKSRMKGFATALPGVFIQKEYNLLSKEYIKSGNNWILFIKIMNCNSTATKEDSMAIAYIDNTYYMTSSGINKVFIIQDKFTFNAGFIELDKLNKHIQQQPDKKPYVVDSNINEMYIVDPPAQLFAKDTTLHKDEHFIGVWLSFGAFIKYDLIDFSNLNIDGDLLSIVEEKLSDTDKFKKILENKSAGLGSVMVDTEKLLHYLLKEAKNMTFSLNKMKSDKICVDDVLYNLQNKGVLGISYEEVKTIKDMYLPVFDYTTANTTNVVGNAVCFIYMDEYIWVIMPKDKDEIYFMSYKGNIYTFENNDKNYKVEVYNNPVLSKLNKIKEDNFLLFGGFSNLQENAVIDFYFDDKTEFLQTNNKKISIDINAFNDYYSSVTKQPNNLFMDKTTLYRAYGNNKYHITTGLLYGDKGSDGLLLKTNIDIKYRTITDIENKHTYICHKVVENNGYIKSNIVLAPLKTFTDYVLNIKKTGRVDAQEIKNIVSKSFVVTGYFNGWATFKDKNNNYTSLQTETDKLYEFIYVDYYPELKKSGKALLNKIINGEKINEIAEANVMYQNYVSYMTSIKKTYQAAISNKIAKTHKISYAKTKRFVFEKVSDDIYILDKPKNEICNHAVLNEKTINNMTNYTEYLINDFYSPYILEAKVKKNKNIISIYPETDNSDPIDVVSYPEFGITINEVTKIDVKYTKLEYKCFIRNSGNRTLDDNNVYNLFEISHGFNLSVDIAAIQKDNTHIMKKQEELSKAEHEKSILKKEIKELDSQNKNVFTKLSKKIEQSYSVDDNFVPVSETILIAYTNGKMLVSIGGDEWFEPYFTNNGLRLSSMLYIDNIDVFEKVIQNLILSNKELVVTNKSIIHKEDMVNVNQIKVEHIEFNIDTSKVYIKFHLADVYCVIDDVLYKPKQTIVKVIDVDVDFDTIVNGKRIIYIDPVITYKTVFPLNKDNIFKDASEVINHDMCFTFSHKIPILFSYKEIDNYQFTNIDEAIESGVKMQFNLRNKDTGTNDIFGNYKLEIVNGIYKEGVGVEPDKTGEVFIKIIPNEDFLTRFITNNEILLVSTNKDYAYEIGIAYSTSDIFEPLYSVIFKEEVLSYVWYSEMDNKYLYNNVPYIATKHSTNTFGLISLDKTIKPYVENKIISVSGHYVDVENVLRKTDLCFYIKSKSAIYSIYSGEYSFMLLNSNKSKKLNKEEVKSICSLSEYPEFLIKARK